MNGIQGTKSAVRKLNQLINAVVKILKYNITTIDHAIYIKVFYYVTVSYLTVFTDDVLDTTKNGTGFPELRGFLEEIFVIKFQEGSVLKYPSYLIYQSGIGFSVHQNDHIMELLYEWFPTGKFKILYKL